MPTLMLRHLSPELVARIKAYAQAHSLGYAPAAVQLLEIALDHLAARTAGASVVNSRKSPEERSAAAKHAVTVREQKRHEKTDD